MPLPFLGSEYCGISPDGEFIGYKGVSLLVML